MSLKYAVIGTGAIGGYYGGRLAQSGKEVHFLFHSDYEYVNEHGLKVDSVNGDFHLYAVNAYKSTSDMPLCDVVLVCLKTTNNNLLKTLLPPLLHKETVVLLIQNGLGVEESLQNDFPDLNIAGGLAFICSNKIGKGYIKHLDYGSINIGSYSCKKPQILDTICNDMQKAGISAKVVELNAARWMKLAWNIPFNGMTVVLNTTTDKLMKDENTCELLYQMMLEVINAANASGCAIDVSYADKMIENTRSMTPYSPSMKLDFDNKNPLEIECIYSNSIENARKNGIDMPLVFDARKTIEFCTKPIFILK